MAALNRGFLSGFNTPLEALQHELKKAQGTQSDLKKMQQFIRSDLEPFQKAIDQLKLPQISAATRVLNLQPHLGATLKAAEMFALNRRVLDDAVKGMNQFRRLADNIEEYHANLVLLTRNMEQILGAAKISLPKLNTCLMSPAAAKLAKAYSLNLPGYLESIKTVQDSLSMPSAARALAALQSKMVAIQTAINPLRLEVSTVSEHLQRIRSLTEVNQKFSAILTDANFGSAIRTMNEIQNIGVSISRDALNLGKKESAIEAKGESGEQSSLEAQSVISHAQHAAIVDAVALILEVGIGVDPYFLRTYVEIMTSKETTREEVDEARLALVAALNVIVPPDDEG